MNEENQPLDVRNGEAENTQAQDNGSGEGQSSGFQRVTAEEAATLDFATLKRRMREEARLHSEGLLPETDAGTESGGNEDDDEQLAGSATEQNAANERNAGTTSQAGGAGTQPETELQTLLRQAQERAQTLEREKRETEETAERNRLETQHKTVEQRIAQLPREQQQLAREAYMNRLGQAALNDYYGYIQQREAAVQAAEFKQVKSEAPGMLLEMAGYVAEQHGIKAESLHEFVKSEHCKKLIENATDRNGFIAAMASIGEMVDWQATREAGRLAAQRDARRQNAAKNNPVQRDTPRGGTPMVGGEVDEANRIKNMSRAEFMAHKKQQLADARAKGLIN